MAAISPLRNKLFRALAGAAGVAAIAVGLTAADARAQDVPIAFEGRVVIDTVR